MQTYILYIINCMRIKISTPNFLCIENRNRNHKFFFIIPLYLLIHNFEPSYLMHSVFVNYFFYAKYEYLMFFDTFTTYTNLKI